MKICLVSDLHLGIKKGADVFLDNQIRYFVDELVPYLKKNDIKHVFMLGDIYDNRNHINVKVKNKAYELFAQHLAPFEIWMVIGNHDTYFRNSTSVHSLKFFKAFSNIHVVEDVERIELANRSMLMVPWQTDTSAFAARVAAKNFYCDICMGHFDINGFRQNKNHICNEGFNSELFFLNYGLTFSGHFHTRSSLKRGKLEIVYIGAPYHLDRSDVGEERGACIVDLDNLTYEYVNSKNTIRYVSVEFPQRITAKMIAGNIVDVVVKIDREHYDENKLHKYVQKIESFKPAVSPRVTVVNTMTAMTNQSTTVKAIHELIYEYADMLNLEDKGAVVKCIQELQEEAKHTTGQ